MHGAENCGGPAVAVHRLAGDAGVETVQKTVEFRSCRLVWVVQFLDKGVDMPVVVQRVDKVVDGSGSQWHRSWRKSSGS